MPCKIHVKCGEYSHRCRTVKSPTTSLAIEVIENRRGSHYHKFRMSTLHAITLVVQAAVTNRSGISTTTQATSCCNISCVSGQPCNKAKGFYMGSNVLAEYSPFTARAVLMYRAHFKLQISPCIVSQCPSTLTTP